MAHGINGVLYSESRCCRTWTMWCVEAPALDPAHYTRIQADGRGRCPCDSASGGGGGGGWRTKGSSSKVWSVEEQAKESFRKWRTFGSNSGKIILHFPDFLLRLSIIGDRGSNVRLAHFTDQLYIFFIFYFLHLFAFYNCTYLNK